MQELLIMLAKIMTPEMVIEYIRDDLKSYDLTPSDDNKKRLATSCMLLAVQVGTESQSMENVLRDFERRKSVIDMYEKSPM